MQTSNTKHLLENFELFGFGNSASAFFQTVKELVENSIDACRKIERKTLIRIRVKPFHTKSNPLYAGNQSQSLLQLVVSDNGHGISNPQTFLKAFSSGIDEHDRSEKRTGKFGIGLTASLLYSQTQCNGNLILTTATKENGQLTVKEFNFDLKKGKPQVVTDATYDKPPNFISGTEVKLVVPEPDTMMMKHVLAQLRSYLTRFMLVPNMKTSIDFESVDCMESFRIHIPLKPEAVHCSPSPENIETSYGTRLFEFLCECNSAENDWNEEPCFDLARAQTQTNPSIKADVTLLLLKNPMEFSEDSQNLCDGIDECNKTETLHQQRIPLNFHRFVNDVPLMDGSQVTSCAMIAALRKVRWKRFGLKLSFDFRESEDHQLQLYLEDIFGEGNGASSMSSIYGLKQLLLTVCFYSQPVRYTSMLKDALYSDDCYISLIREGIEKTFDEISQKSVNFRSLEVLKNMRMTKLYIPMIAAAFSDVISSSRNVAFQKQCLGIIGCEDDYIEPKKLSNSLAEKMLDVFYCLDKPEMEGKSNASNGFQQHSDNILPDSYSEDRQKKKARLSIIG